MMLAMFAGENRDDWDDLLPALIGPITSPYVIWVRDALEVAFDQVHRNSGQAVQRQKRLYDGRAVRWLFAVGDWALRY